MNFHSNFRHIAPYKSKSFPNVNKNGNNQDDDDVDLSSSFTLSQSTPSTTTTATTTLSSTGNANSTDFLYPDHEKLMVDPNHQKVSQIVTAMANTDPSKIVFPDQLPEKDNNRDQLTFKPMPTTTMPPTIEINGYTYANCGVFANVDSSKVSATADAKFVVFPNGTKVSIAKCQVQVTLNRNKS